MIITLRPHLPIRGKPVNIDIASPTTKLIDEICVVGDKEGFHDCGVVFQPGHRVGRPMRFKLMTNCATGDKSATLDATYELQHSFFDFSKINRFWVNHPFPQIKVRLSLISLIWNKTVRFMPWLWFVYYILRLKRLHSQFNRWS